MKKVLKISLFFIFLFLLFCSKTNTYAQTPPVCPNVRFDRTTIFGAQTTNLTDLKIYPVDQTITIKLPIAGNPNDNYSLYAYTGDISKPTQEGWVVNDKGQLLCKTSLNNEIQFVIDRDTYLKLTGIWDPLVKDRHVIPMFADLKSWKNEDVYFKLIKTGARCIEQAGLANPCQFKVTPAISCGDFSSNYLFSSSSQEFSFDFGNTGLIREPDGKFQFKKAVPQSYEIRATKNALEEQKPKKIFSLRKNPDTSYFFGGDTSMQLYSKLIFSHDNIGLCEQPYIPVDETFENDLKKCSINPGKDAGDIFNYQLTVQNVPSKMLDAKGQAFVELGQMIGDYSVPYIIFLPADEYDNLKKDRTIISGIASFDDLFFHDHLRCDDPASSRCYRIALDKLSSYTQAVTSLPGSGNEGEYELIVGYHSRVTLDKTYDGAYLIACQNRFYLSADGKIEPRPTPPPFPSVPAGTVIPTMDMSKDQLCSQVSPLAKHTECINCIRADSVWTALGCISTDIGGFVASFFRIGLGIAGGVAFLFLIFGGFTVLTSAGNPETIQQGKDTITSAITGLLLIIFSIFLLQLISVDILKIPGFSKDTSTVTTPACRNLCADGKTCCKITETCDEPIPGRFSCKAPCPAGSTLCDTSTNPPLCCSSGQTCTKLPVPHCQ